MGRRHSPQVESLGADVCMLGRNQLHLQFVPLFPLSDSFIVTKVSDKSERCDTEGHCLSFPTRSPLATGATVSGVVTVISVLSFSSVLDRDVVPPPRSLQVFSVSRLRGS